MARRIVLIFICLACGVVGAYFGQPYLHNNSDAITVIVTVTTVFAGFLVAIVAILGDPAMLPEGSWRLAELRREKIENSIIRHLWLFVFYLTTIAFLFAGVLINKSSEIPSIIKIWTERAYLFFFISSFLFTLGLPSALWKYQMARIDGEIKRRRKAAGIEDDDI